MRKKINKIQPGGGEVVIYKGANKTPILKVRLENESVWLTQKQMAELFGIGKAAISKHVKNIFDSGELKALSTVSILETVQSEGGRQIHRKIECFNLDMIISIGYRVNSVRATQFRIWATSVLRSHLIQGYTINQKRLEEQQMRLVDLQKAVAFIREKAHRPGLAGQTQKLLSVIQDYTNSLTLLYKYDKDTLVLKRAQKARVVLNYENARALVDKTKERLMKKKEAGDLFGNEYGEKFKAILGALYQTFGGKELYGSVEEKAANLLYLIIKDHPFNDGNKRIGSLLFVYFLERNRYLWRKTGERKISDTTLVALALLIAESDPKEKDVMIKLVTNLL